MCTAKRIDHVINTPQNAFILILSCRIPIIMKNNCQTRIQRKNKKKIFYKIDVYEF